MVKKGRAFGIGHALNLSLNRRAHSTRIKIDYGQGGLLFGVPGLGLPRGGGHSLQLGFVFVGVHVFPLLGSVLAARATIADMENTTNSAAVDMVFNPFSFITKLLCKTRRRVSELYVHRLLSSELSRFSVYGLSPM